MAKIERTYNVPLRAGFMKAPKYKRAKKAVTTLKTFLAKHMKSEDIKIGKSLNNHIWQRGIKNPPHHVKVDAVKDSDGTVKAELHGVAYQEETRPKPKEEGGMKERIQDKLGLKQKRVETDEAPAETKKTVKKTAAKPAK